MSYIVPPAPAPTNGVNNTPSVRPFPSNLPVPFMSPPTISPATDPVRSPFKPPEPKVPAALTPPPTISPFPPTHPSPKSGIVKWTKGSGCFNSSPYNKSIPSNSSLTKIRYRETL
ncbi:extensin-like [Impatiens glandulifera]|uniref:extensin-like n=1 Tax=Impatiens glandulifera TaxID=253017 RepID=UPI001FB0AF54|nr:extensin-like [Impatiens glandulifera]